MNLRSANFSATQTAAILALSTAICIFLAGCGTSGGSSGGGTETKGASFAYMFSYPSGTQVLQFPLQSSGTGTPSATLNLPPGFTGGFLATDSTGQLYVGLESATGVVFEVAVYPANSSGAATPSRIITFGKGATAAAVDAQGYLYLSLLNPSTINVYSPTATGAATPVRSISGSGLPDAIYQLAVDSSDDVYVAAAGSVNGVLVFGPAATGNASPIRTINGTSYCNTDGRVYGVTVEPNGNIAFVCANDMNAQAETVIQELPPESNGSSTPLRTIVTSPYSGTAYNISTLASDSANNLYEVDGTSGDLKGFSPTMSGTATPFVSVGIGSASGSTINTLYDVLHIAVY